MNQPLSTTVTADRRYRPRTTRHFPMRKIGLTELSPGNGSAALREVAIGLDRLYERCWIVGHDRVVGHISRHNEPAATIAPDPVMTPHITIAPAPFVRNLDGGRA